MIVMHFRTLAKASNKHHLYGVNFPLTQGFLRRFGRTGSRPPALLGDSECRARSVILGRAMPASSFLPCDSSIRRHSARLASPSSRATVATVAAHTMRSFFGGGAAGLFSPSRRQGGRSVVCSTTPTAREDDPHLWRRPLHFTNRFAAGAFPLGESALRAAPPRASRPRLHRPGAITRHRYHETKSRPRVLRRSAT